VISRARLLPFDRRCDSRSAGSTPGRLRRGGGGPVRSPRACE
jgi:hypothetical protein